eukprot:jgi/Tetstr1/464812/TSEL_009551.t1
MIDFACVSSTTPTWSNDPRWCIPGIAATEAEHAKLAADRASSAPVQGVHRYYPFVVEDRGRLGKSALTVVYIFAVLLAMRLEDFELLFNDLLVSMRRDRGNVKGSAAAKNRHAQQDAVGATVVEETFCEEGVNVQDHNVALFKQYVDEYASDGLRVRTTPEG